ncbi:MAG: hypothetical protein GXY43_07910 [Clostridiaceae bacterium]|nr:hypothetical protein [Clostridiaceae bacterium]
MHYMKNLISSFPFSAAEVSSVAGTSSYSLNEKGFIVVAFGLIGVFLILLLFFVTIILIQKVFGSVGTRKKLKES